MTNSPSTEAPVGGSLWLHKRASAEGAKKTVFQGFFVTEGTPEGRRSQQPGTPGRGRLHSEKYLLKMTAQHRGIANRQWRHPWQAR